MLNAVHAKGVNCESTTKIGDSLTPSVDHVMNCLKNKSSLPPHLEHLNRGIQVPKAQLEAEIAKLKEKAADAFFEVGFRLLDGQNAQVMVVIPC